MFFYLFSYSAGEIHFNLLAVVSDKRKVYEKEIIKLDTRKELAAKKVNEMMM